MFKETHYATVSEAINMLRKQGFTIDFNLEENADIFFEHTRNSDTFEIIDVYRYEGDSDPGDEATVYAIASKSGLKGVLVTGFGASSDSVSGKILRKLHNRDE